MRLKEETSKKPLTSDTIKLVIQKLIPLVFILLTLTLVSLSGNPSQWQPLLLKLSTSTNRVGGTVANDLKDSSKDDHETTTTTSKCDLFTGEWVPNPNAPYYTNATCSAIQQHQNCLKYGRPDLEFLKWRWKPDGCELPLFDPAEFLEMMRGKSIAFVGDSVARNHMQSLICLLSRVQHPIDESPTPDENFKKWKYAEYNFTMATLWSPYLVRSREAYTDDPVNKYLCNLYLDESDDAWTSQIDKFDYVIISGGHWFSRPLIYYENQKIVGCLYCKMDNVTHFTKFYGIRKAFMTAFRAINSRKNYKGVTYLRTFAPSHFEGGAWNEGGNCVRTRPFKRNETLHHDEYDQLYQIQIEEFRKAELEGIMKNFRLLDTTRAMVLRPDGHPSKYGYLPHDKVERNDCVHWCLPGPIDSWSDLLLQMLKMEELHHSSHT